MAVKRRGSGGGARKAERPAAPRASDDRSKRLLDLVVLLLGARSPVSFRELRAQFRAYRTENEEAGLRAFERDKVELLELGVPVRYVTPEDDDTFEEAGYVVDLRRYRLPELAFTPDEVAALVLASSMARAAHGTTYAEVVDLAVKKLAFDAPPAPDTPGTPVRQREPVLVHFPRPADAERLAERLALIEQAVVSRKRLTLDYVAASGKSARREVDPYGLAYRQGVWLVVGHCRLREDVRSFRLDRIAGLEVAPRPRSPDFQRPAEFDLRRYASRSPWTFELGAAVAIELEFHPPATAVGAEDFGDGARREPIAGGPALLVQFESSNLDYVVSRVLASKGAIVVRSPAALARRVRDELDSILALYA